MSYLVDKANLTPSPLMGRPQGVRRGVNSPRSGVQLQQSAIPLGLKIELE